MASRKPKPKTAAARIEEFGSLFAMALNDLSKLECPLCGSHLLNVTLIAHSGIIFDCTGVLDTLNNDAQLEPYECTYRYRVPYRHIARLESLQPFVAREVVVGAQANQDQRDPEDIS